MKSQKDIESFLKLGYFLDYKNPTYSFDYSMVNKQNFKEYSEEELIEKGSDLYINAIESEFELEDSHVVPISGGMDSRAILGALLEFTDATNIYTYTFGTPDTLDYEIGNNIAKVLGTKHVNLPLTNHIYKMEELLDVSRRVDHQTVLFHHPPIWELDKLFGDSTVWSGFLGGVTGSIFNTNDPTEINQAKELFIKKNNYQSGIFLTSDRNYSYDKLLDLNYHECNDISLMELLHFDNRQLKFIAPHVLMKGFKYKIPLLNQNLFNFFLSIENKYRNNQDLYKKILLNLFPQLFSYPLKSQSGLPLNASSPKLFFTRAINKGKRILGKNSLNKHINYLDFDLAIRQKNDLTEIVRENIYDLYDRKIVEWLDVRQVYVDHIKKNRNYGKALLLLASLEIHMKSKEININ